jgi:hypothetical protein
MESRKVKQVLLDVGTSRGGRIKGKGVGAWI